MVTPWLSVAVGNVAVTVPLSDVLGNELVLVMLCETEGSIKLNDWVTVIDDVSVDGGSVKVTVVVPDAVGRV